MRKKYLKLTALVTTMLLVVSLFAGCVVKESEGTKSLKDDSKSDTTSGSPASTEEKDKYQPIEGKHYEITCLNMTISPVGENSFMVQKYNEVFNVKLKPLHVEAGKWDELLNIKLSSGDIPDVIPSKSTDRFLRYLHGELLQEVPMEVLKKYAPDVVEAINRDDPKSWSVCSYEGRNYGIPYIVANYIIRDPIVWRDDWLKSVGINKIPDTLSEWEEALVKFRNDDPNNSGSKDTYGGSISMFAPVFGAHGVYIDAYWNSYFLEKDGKIIASAIEPGAKKALELLSKWYKMDVIDPEFVSGENKGGYWAISTDFVNGKIGVSAMGNTYHWQKEGNGLLDGADAAEMKKIDPNASYQFGNPPVGPDGKTRGMNKFPLCTGVSYVFSKKMEPDKLGKVLQMFNWTMEDFDNYLLNRYGLEGKHHQVVKGENSGYNVYSYVEPYKSDGAKGMNEVGVGALFMQQDVANARKLSGAYIDYFLELGFDKYGIEDMSSKLYMPSYATYATDLKSAMQEAYINIITGKKSIEYFDEFVEKWKRNGGEQVLKEANEHYAKIK